jgi:DNA polymerase III delta prime subunit
LILIENIYYNSLENLDNRSDYIKLIQNNINSFKERNLSFDETANLTITLLQNYITIFSGPPGVGKTSTVNNLGKALGLFNSESQSDNFLNIAVGRGWTTTQDFLGYYNSLRDCFQPSKTGLYQFLKANTSHEEFLKIVLLDEANLSSIEHYWSDFLSICDDFDQNKFIDLGTPDSESRFLSLPPSLRFIGTINNDSTVEPLSDRFLDRAAIITLNNDQINNNYNISELLNGAIPYDTLKDSFMVSSIDNDIDNVDFSINIDIIRNVISEFKSDNVKGGQVHISSRKVNTIKRYLKIASDIGFENHIAPADYAISQHILPKIKGHGPSLKIRLENVLKILKDNDLKNSQKILTSILNNGNSFTNSFDFFN